MLWFEPTLADDVDVDTEKIRQFTGERDEVPRLLRADTHKNVEIALRGVSATGDGAKYSRELCSALGDESDDLIPMGA
jgi:hypothetical protein